MDTKTYRAVEGFGKTGQTVREFGERQNAMNAALEEENRRLNAQLQGAEARIAELEQALQAALERIEAVEQEQSLNIRRFGKCAADLDKVERDIDRLRLTAKLNSNAIDRLTKK